MAQSLTDFVANLKRITELDVNNGNDPSDDMFSIMASSISDFVAEGDQSDEILDIIENNREDVINIIDGINSDVDDLREEAKNAVDNILAIRDLVDGEFKPQLNLEILSRKESDRALFDTTASLAEFRRKSSEFENDITDAVFEVNPEDGTINLRAYSYTDEAFSQAGILIDGVNAEVSIQAGRITDLGNSVEDANSEINVLSGKIELTATYTEMTEYVSGALDAVIPAYSFGFFNSSEGWSAVNGNITQGNGKILTSWGDIENQALSYVADENPVITITLSRTSGTGYTGDLVVFFDDNSAETYTGVIEDTAIDTTNVKVLNLSEETSYTGTVTGLRVILGESESDLFEIESITVGKPSAQLEALDGITAQVNQLGIDINAIDGQLSSFVTTTFYDENTVTLNNVTQVLDGEDAIISFKATQNVLNEQGTIDKANTASFWVDAAEANITTTLTSFNAQEGGIDDQLAGLNGSVNTINQELSTIDGASIRTQLLSINNLEIESGNLEEAQFYTELKLLDQKNRDLTLGDSIATIDTQTKTLATDSQALAQQITELSASIGTIEGQVDANATFILNTDAKADGTAQSLAALETEVTNTQGDLSTAELLLDSTVDDLGEVSSRAFLGVSGTVDGKTTVTGITADSATNGLRFQGDVIQFDDTDGNPALRYRADLDKWEFTGNVVVGGYTVESEDDIRALDGDTVYEVYQYSVDGSTDWHDDYTTGDIFRRTATVTNGVQSAWRDLSRITGFTPEIVNNPDGSYTITNGTESATIFDGVDGQDAPIPTAVDNGDGTYTITDGEGNSVTVSNGENGETPVKGIDYFDGLDGSFVSNIYITSSTGTPPSPDGGTFDGNSEVIPDSYQDSPYFEEGKITYISTTRYSQQTDGSWLKSGWSTPTKYIIKGDEGPQGVAGKDSVSLVAKELYDFINDSYQWVGQNATLTNNPTYLTVETTTNDPRLIRINEGMSVIGSENPIVAIRMRSTIEISTEMQVYYATSGHGISGSYYKQVSVSLPANQWVSFEVDMRELTVGGSDWVNSTITGLRIDPVQLSGISLDIDYILVGKAGAAVDGVDGVTTYTWIRYADSVTGGGISNDPTNKAYIGLAYNQTSPIESTDPDDYTWSLIKGTDGVKGDTGEDGTTFYTWVAYSDFPDGTDLYQTPNENTLYIGISPNQLSPTESNVKTDYTWSRFKGEKGESAYTNLTRSEGQWVVGTSGSQGNFIQYGDTSQNRVISEIGPEGTIEPVWEASGISSTQAGGFLIPAYTDTTKSYRYSVWMKEDANNDHIIYWGPTRSVDVITTGSESSNPYFLSEVDLPSPDKWYLAVAFLHADSYTGDVSGMSGIYDPDTGTLVDTRNYEYRSGTQHSDQGMRLFRFNAETSNTKAYFCRPRIEEINGEEVSLASLMGRIPKDGAVGAGFYGSTYSSITWDTPTATSRFSSLVGRSPVNGDIFTQTRIDGTDSQARQYNGTSWVTVALQVNGSIVARDTIAGDRLIAGTEISAPKITGGEINGGEIIGSRITTSDSSMTRVEIEDDGTYMQWIGTGAKTDENALFFIKSNGTGFIKGDFFQGQILRERFGSSTTNTVTASGHLSAGRPVRLTSTLSFRKTTESTSNISGVPITLDYTIKRNSTTIKTGTLYPARTIIDNGGEGGVPNIAIDHLVQTLIVEDDTSSSGVSYSYTLTLENINDAVYDLTLSTYENLIG